jgi:signal transduction histidine kinase
MEETKNQSALEAENARLRGDLLTVSSRIGHDLRTPLGGILTGAEALREILAEKNLPVAFTQAIVDSVDDLTRLIRQISFVLKASAHPQPKEPVNMGDVVETALQRVESRVVKKNATVVKPDSWPAVNGVAAWLDMIWWNFLMNSLHHPPEKPRIELSWREEDGWYRFGISDNGGGVPETIRPGLFQPFETLHRPDSTRGLGLSIVQRLVELQGGKCGYEPIAGGSFFFFLLPR